MSEIGSPLIRNYDKKGSARRTGTQGNGRKGNMSAVLSFFRKEITKYMYIICISISFM